MIGDIILNEFMIHKEGESEGEGREEEKKGRTGIFLTAAFWGSSERISASTISRTRFILKIYTIQVE